MEPTEAYKYDNTFRNMVDIMRHELTAYNITPAELRQAAILAATMHDAENIRPLFIKEIYIDEWKPWDWKYPAMFGGAETGRIQTNTPNFTVQDKKAGLDKQYDTMLKYNCICGYKGSNKDLHSQTCKDYNWEILHPKLEHCHTFRASGYGFDVCADCGMSDVYYNYEYNKK